MTIEIKVGDKYCDNKFGDTEVEVIAISPDKKEIKIQINRLNGMGSLAAVNPRREMKMKEFLKSFRPL